MFGHLVTLWELLDHSGRVGSYQHFGVGFLYKVVVTYGSEIRQRLALIVFSNSIVEFPGTNSHTDGHSSYLK